MNRTALFASLATLIAGTAQGADILDLNSLPSRALAEEDRTVLDITGLRQNQLQIESSSDLSDSRLIRLRQYHLGVPVLGETVVVESGTNAIHDAVTRASGRVLLNLDKVMPDVEPSVSYDNAIITARQYARLTDETASSLHLYIDLDHLQGARLVYLIDLEGTVGKSTSRVSVLMDANTGLVLESWNSMDAGDGNGPGQVLRSVRERLISLGWSNDQIDTLLQHTAQLYWRDNAVMAETSCGADLAAVDLGFSVDEVRLAFHSPDKCRTNVRQYRTGTVEDSGETAKTLMAPASLAKASLGTKVEDTQAWQKVTTTNIAYLKPYNTAALVYDRGKVVLPFPYGIHMNNFYADVRRDRFRTSWDACGTAANCVHFRGKATGNRTTTTSYTNWAPVSGYDIRVIPNNSRTGPITKNQWIPWTTAVAKTAGWKVSTTQELSYAAKFTFPILAAAETTVTLKVGATEELNGQTTATITANHSVPGYKIPVGCEMAVQLQHRWQAYTDTWDVKPEFKGTVYDRDAEDGAIEGTVTATTFFASPTKNSTFTINQQNAYSTRAWAWGRKLGSTSLTTTTGCALIAL